LVNTDVLYLPILKEDISMYEHIIQAAQHTAQEIIQARLLDEAHLRAIAPTLAASAIYDATEQRLRQSAVQYLTEDDFTKSEYAQLEAVFIRELISTYARLSPQASTNWTI
jgi:hypothetical protein